MALFHDFINVLCLTVGKDSFCVQSLIPSLRLVRRRTFSDDLRSTRKKGHASKYNVYGVATLRILHYLSLCSNSSKLKKIQLVDMMKLLLAIM